MSPGEVAFALGVVDDAVFHAGCDVYLVEERSARAVVEVEGEHVASVEFVEGAHFNGSVVEALCGALAERVLRCASVAHVSVAVVLCVRHPA